MHKKTEQTSGVQVLFFSDIAGKVLVLPFHVIGYHL